MKSILLFAFCCITCIAVAQKRSPYPSVDSILLTGLVNKNITILLSEVGTMPDTTLSNVKILTHAGEYKFTYQQAKLVSLKNLLTKNLATSQPKEMQSFYFVCKAADGFTVVYSYNELFNTAAGGIFILTAYDNFTISNMPERPILFVTGDFKAGKMGMRGLSSIDVRQAK